MLSLPESPQLRRILLAYTINELGTWFAYIALAIGVYDHTHSAIATAALFISARLLPALLTPAVVARVEASERGGELSGLYLLEAVSAAALALLLWHFWLPGVLVLVAIDGIAAFSANALLRAAAARTAVAEMDASADASARATISPEAEDEAVESAQREVNAALSIAFAIASSIGPVIAGIVVATAGGATALLIDAGSFLACATLLRSLRSHVEELERSSVRARLVAGWEHLRAVPHLRSLLITQAVAMIFFASIEPVEVLYAKGTLHGGSLGYGVLVAAWGVGMVLGGALFARLIRQALGPMIAGGALLLGLAYLGFAGAPTLALAYGAALIGGVGNSLQWASMISAVQKLTPDALHGRLMSAVQSINALSPAIGFALGGAIASLSSPRGAMLTAGLAAVIAALAFLRLSLAGLTPIATGEASEAAV